MHGSGDGLVVGVDAGGSRVRALVVDPAGRRLGTGTAAGANPVSRGLDAFASQLELALSDALATIPAGRVELVALALAGGITGGRAPSFAERMAGIWLRVGLSCPWKVLSDLEVAYFAGTTEPDGLVVLSGTGAAVGLVEGGALSRHLDGTGWLLGDIGSGYWLGHAALRAAIADRDARGRPTVLTDAVADWLRVPLPPRPEPTRPGADRAVDALVSAAYGRVPVSLSELAPVVSAAAAADDPVAVALVENAAATLLGQADLLLADAGPIRTAVLAGGVLLADGPLRQAVRSGLAEDRGLAVCDAADGAAGAAWLGRSLIRRDRTNDRPASA